MYRIRLVSGDEAHFGSIDELGAAVAAGTVTDKAEIYHARAEKWLPIASHPHFKLAKDKVSGGARPAARPAAAGAQVPPRQVPPGSLRAAASGSRPALTASGQRPAIVTATRPGAQPRPHRPVTAPRPAQPRVEAPAPANDLGLLRADPALETAPADVRPFPDIQLEQSPTIEVPQVVAPVNGAAPLVEPAPPQVELVSDEARPAALGATVEIIHPDRAIPSVPVRVERDPVREPPSVEIPAPVRDFSPQVVEGHHAAPVEQRPSRPSRTPILIGIGVAAAAAIAAGFIFNRKPSVPAAPVATQQAPAPTTVPVSVPVSQVPEAAVDPVNQDQVARTEDGSVRKPRRTSEASGAGGADGLEPPPDGDLIPEAPRIGAIGNPAVLPTVDANVSAVDNRKALEQTVREIDSSMRRESGKSGGSTR